LEISQNKIEDEGLKYIGDLHNLLILYVENCDICNDGFKYITNIENLLFLTATGNNLIK